MPKVEFIEKTIFNIEGFNVTIKKEGKDVRGDASLPYNYKAGKMTKNAANVSFFKEKLHKQYPGYEFDILDNDGNKQRGNVLLSTVRDTYLTDEEEVLQGN
jgi:hypothetical protein